MSRNVIEKLLHQLCVDRGVKERFREDADKLLARYALTDEERRMVLTFDVSALQRHGVNPPAFRGVSRLDRVGPDLDLDMGRVVLPLADPELLDLVRRPAGQDGVEDLREQQ